MFNIVDFLPLERLRSFLRSGLWLVVTGVVFFAHFADAQSVAKCNEPQPQPVAFTLSGGVSLGAYQAGSLAYSTLVLKTNPAHFKTQLISGTSAGALNAFLTAIASCQERLQLPTQSEFYRSWVEFKGEELTREARDQQGLFSKSVFAKNVSRVEAIWKQGLPTSCDLVIGLSATRVTPLSDGSYLESGRQAEKFSIRVRGRGPGKSPLLSNYVNPTLFPRALLLDLKPHDDAQNFEALTKALFASASFPLAFAPESLNSCVASSKNVWVDELKAFTCSTAEVQTADFVDGGIYDNKPFALAERLVRTGLMQTTCGDSLWRTLPLDTSKDTSSNLANAKLLYFYSDLNSSAAETEKTKPARGALKIMSVLLESLLNASRSNDSRTLLEQTPDLKNQIAPLTNQIPRLGDALWGFFGFYERDFRDFDFHLGVWEAREVFKNRFKDIENFVLPEFQKTSVDAKKLACLDASYHVRSQTQSDVDSICRLTQDIQFQKLVGLSIARIRAKRTDLQFALAYLADEKFEYRDLGLKGDQSRQAPAMIKRAAMKSVAELAKRQSFSEGFVVSAAGPLMLNMIEPLPTYRDLAVTFGSQTQATLSTLLDSLQSFRPRWTLGLGLENTSAWLGSGGGKVVATPLIGLEFEPAALNSSLLQTRLSASVGYKFGEGARDSQCRDQSRFTQDCTGVSTRLGASFTIIERVRFQTEFEAMPFQKTSPMPWRLLPTVGLQFYF